MATVLPNAPKTVAEFEAVIGRCPECDIDLRHGRAFSVSCTRCAEREAAREDQP